MNRLTSGVSLGLGLLVLSVARAESKDFCIRVEDGTLFIGKSFSVPNKGKCKPWLGFSYDTHPLSDPGFGFVHQTGVACTASDGSHVTIALEMIVPIGNARLNGDIITLPLPGLTGGTDWSANGYVSPTFAADMVDCPSQPVPVP
jgi:hypothetical protein